MRATLLFPILLLSLSTAWGQATITAPAPTAAAPATAAPATAPATLERAQPAPGSRADQRIEHIQVEDKSVRIDELRYGGETQNITVQPTNGMPAYEIVPANGARSRPQGERDSASGNSGQRVWKLFNF
jgi:hypothetical protein